VGDGLWRESRRNTGSRHNTPPTATRRRRHDPSGVTAAAERQRLNAKVQRRKGLQMKGNGRNTALIPLLLQTIRAEVAADHHIAPRCLDPADGPCAFASGGLLFVCSSFALRLIVRCARKAARIARRCNAGSRQKTRPTATRLRRHDTSTSRPSSPRSHARHPG